MSNQNLPKWENYSGDYEKPASPDQLERPPLIGKQRTVPEGLYDQPWGTVGDAYGKATLTPYYIEALTSDNEGDVEFGCYGLYSATTHQGSVYKASKMAVPFLAELLGLENDTADLACHFLARIALGENHFIRTPAGFYKTKYYGAVRKHQEQIMACYERTRSLEALRLLCFFPKALPDQLDCTYETALQQENGNQGRAFVRQAATLITQGFLAAERNFPGKGYPPYAQEARGGKLKVTAHVEEARRLAEESPSLLVRGSAAICLVYTGAGDVGLMELLAELAQRSLNGVPWVWDDSFSALCKNAWLYGADLETLLTADHFSTLDYTSRTRDGVETKHYSRSELMIEAASRVFPLRYEKDKKEMPSLLPSGLTELQKRVLQGLLETAPRLFGSYHIEALNLPQTIEGAKRLLKASGEILCTEMDGRPLWHLLEEAARGNEPEPPMEQLAQVDAWRVLGELYQPRDCSIVPERCTLSLKHYNPKTTAEWDCRLQSIMADALKGYGDKIRPFLDEWLEKSQALSRDDWSTQTKAQRTGVCLLALARAGQLDEKYTPLVRPYHRYAIYSSFPTVLLKEVLEHTPAEHQSAVIKEFGIK